MLGKLVNNISGDVIICVWSQYNFGVAIMIFNEGKCGIYFIPELFSYHKYAIIVY